MDHSHAWAQRQKGAAGGPQLRKSGGPELRKSGGTQLRKLGGSDQRKFCNKARKPQYAPQLYRSTTIAPAEEVCAGRNESSKVVTSEPMPGQGRSQQRD